MTLFDQPTEAPARRIVEHLQRHGHATIRELEGVLGVTTTAVRAHLAGLLAEGYIERRAVHKGVGRPVHAYALTAKARTLYACHCDDLALTLLQEVFAVEGSARATWLLDRVGNRLAQRYAGSVRAPALRERVEQMAQVLQQRGVLTDVEAAPAEGAPGPFDASAIQVGGEDVFLLKAYNCPFHELAAEHREICAMDERMLRQVLGADVHLSGCMMEGQARCTFVVRPHAPGALHNGHAATLPAPPALSAPSVPFAAPLAASAPYALPQPATPLAPLLEKRKDGKEGKEGKKKKHKKGR